MKKCIVISMVILMGLATCQTYSGKKVIIPEKPFEKLSQYNFFSGELHALNPASGVLPYDLNSPLFSDYASKARFVWMPEGSSASYTTDRVLDFPEGTVLIKNFFYDRDARHPSAGRHIIETRLLINRGESWDAYEYVWDSSGTEAYYDVIGDIQNISWIDRDGQDNSVEYIIPNKNQCKNCHALDNVIMPIGPKIANLNKDYVYADGSMNQLDKWAQTGFLTGYDPSMPQPRLAVWDDSLSYSLHDRAMAYLDINCGHCHNPEGAANTSGLTLQANAPLGTALGIYKPTVSAGAGTGGHTYNIVPGHPDQSIMIYRMASTNPGAMMPELGRRLVHREGLQLIAQWIAAMEPQNEGSQNALLN